MPETIYDWDDSLRVRTTPFYKNGMAVAGPPSLTGMIQTGQTDAGFWTASYLGVVLRSAAEIKAFRRLSAVMAGGGALIRVPVRDGANRPWPLSGGLPVAATASTGFSDGTQFSDGTGFRERTILVDLDAAAAKGQTQITVSVDMAGEIAGGEYFTLGERLHIIQEVQDVSGSEQTWRIWPRLRQAYAAGAQLEFDRPTCLMRLRPGTASDPIIAMTNDAVVDLEFIEAFTRDDRS